MSEQILDILNNHIAKIEKSLREDIVEIKSDIKELKTAHIETTKLLIKLSSVDEKFRMQADTCKETRTILDKFNERIEQLEKDMIPVKQFLEMKNKITASIVINAITWFVITFFTIYNFFLRR